MNVEVFSIGSRVNVGTSDDRFEATIAAVCIRGVAHQVQYECVWWDGKTRTTAWCDESEVIASDASPTKLTIGYAGGAA